MPFSFALSPESHEHGRRQVFWLVPVPRRLPDPETGRMTENKRLVGKNGELYGFVAKGHDESSIRNYRKAWEYYKQHSDEMERDRKAFRQYKACRASCT